MPTNRTRLKREKRDFCKLPENYYEFFRTSDEGNELDIFFKSDDELRAMWNEHKADVLRVWIREHPGTRPWAWWKWDAPRQQMGTWPGCYWDGKLPESRKRAGGIGIVAWDKLNVKPWHFKGIPKMWYGIDYADLPRFESEANYLKRHGLLCKEEIEKLTDSDYESVTLDDIPYTDFDWENFERALNEN